MRLEYRRLVSNSDTAVLFVHGILGTPLHFNDFIPILPTSWSVYNILLAGHGGDVGDFAAATMPMWKQQVETELNKLRATHKRVIMVTHSMGGLFAIKLAVKYPQVVGLFLISPPLKIQLRERMIVSVAKMFAEYFSGQQSHDIHVDATKQATSIQLDPRVYKYLPWAKNYINLFREERDTRQFVPALTAKTVVVICEKDELVSPNTRQHLTDNIKVIDLADSTHFYYPLPDKTRMLAAFKEFCSEF